MATLIFLCGPHTAGKTSILNRLEKEGHIKFKGLEIGKELFYQRKLDTKTQGMDFELEVTKKELGRDSEIAKIDDIAMVETWHVGNLAYADIRNPQGVEILINKITKTPFWNEAICIKLNLDKEEIKKRTLTFKDDKDWAAEFYTKIDENIMKYINKLNFKKRTYEVNANRNFEEVYNDVLKIVKKVSDIK